MQLLKWTGFPLILVLAVAVSATVTGAAAATRQVEGCQLLQDQSCTLCMAKVSCAGTEAAIAAIRPLFASCAAGQRVPAAAVQSTIDRFETPVVFQCCIGNDLGRSLPQHSRRCDRSP